MHFIQEIRFLKAFYWANLGKFAFTPEDRVEWTERAKKDFDVLGISPDTYCNPDPDNLYYRNFQADLCASSANSTTTAGSSHLPYVPDDTVVASNSVIDRKAVSSDNTD